MLTKTDIEISRSRQTKEVVLFSDPVSGSHAEVYEYYNGGDEEFLSYSISSIWVPQFARGSGLGSALLRTILDHYDRQGENLRLVVAGCCAPARDDRPEDVEEMHKWGHYASCKERIERLSHHDLRRWYMGYGFVERPSMHVAAELCCTYKLYRKARSV